MHIKSYYIATCLTLATRDETIQAPRVLIIDASRKKYHNTVIHHCLKALETLEYT